MTERRSPIWRRILSWVFLILFCLAAPVALVTGWARLTVVDEDVYVRTVSRAAGDRSGDAQLPPGIAGGTTYRPHIDVLVDDSESRRRRSPGAAGRLPSGRHPCRDNPGRGQSV